jgi:Na+-driven multidrug efflux pump
MFETIRFLWKVSAAFLISITIAHYLWENWLVRVFSPDVNAVLFLGMIVIISGALFQGFDLDN